MPRKAPAGQNAAGESTGAIDPDAAAASSLRIEEQGDGFLIEYPILSLDLPDEASFNFCSGVQDLLTASSHRGPQRQTLLSEEAFNVLKWRGLAGSFLPCPYFRPISLGNLSVELLPSGEGCGSAFLHIMSSEQASVLYANRWSLLASRALRAAAPKPAQHLLLRLWKNPAEASHIQDRKELSRFYDFVTRIVRAGEWTVALLPCLSVLQMVLGEMQIRRLPVYMEQGHLRGLQSLRGEGFDDGPGQQRDSFEVARRLPQRFDTESDPPGLIVLCSDSVRQGRRPALPSAIWCSLGEPGSQQNLNLQAGVTISEHFHAGLAPDLSDIQTLIHAVKPQRVTVSGPGADGVAASLSRQGLRTRAVLPAMMTLF